MSHPETRHGLAPYPSTRANEMSATGKPVYQDASSSNWQTKRTPRSSAAATSKPASTAQEEPKRLSGGKRGQAEASRTDVVNHVPGSKPEPERPAKKQKITYLLPNQCMDEGHFYIVLGEDIDVSTGRFKMLSLLGQGTFGKVVEAWDRKYKIHCAVKIVRNIPKYTRDASIEVKYMEKVRLADPDDKYCFMKILRFFQNDQKHMCICMPKYGPCLLDWIQRHGPLKYNGLAKVIHQSMSALNFFHTQLKMMHTDLKPENMLMESDETITDEQGHRVSKNHNIRICDLGGCCDERHSKTAIVSTRHYRSPEVILGTGWMYATDMWSMGCIIYELFTGKLLYDTHENLEHLHIMEKTLGRLPLEFSRNCADEHRNMFTASGTLKPLTDPKSMARVAKARPVRETITDPELRDMIIGLLNYDKTKRYTAKEMLTHPFVRKYFPDAPMIL